MKKAMKRFFATLLSAAMVLGSLTIPAAAADDEYQLFIAYGGDAAESGDWGYGYTGPAGDNTDGIEGVVETIKAGETKTVSITLPSECVYTWYMAPVLLAENVEALDVTVSVAVDGTEVDIDASAGDAWWYEGTGNYSDKESIRLYGGYNEWGAQYIASPTFTTIEYTVTINDITISDGTSNVNAVESTEEYNMFLAFGGDAAEENDWGLGYAGGDASEGMTVTDGTITSGGTGSVKIEFDNPVVNAWYFAPTILATDVVEADFSVQVLVDGEEVDVDMEAGPNWWYEATGDYDDKTAIRVAGGYNEWGAQYIAEPSGFTSLEFVITAGSIKVGEAVEEGPAYNDIDLDAEYHAYIGFQSPVYSFRNAWDGDDGYGNDTPEFSQVTGWGDENEELSLAGTFEDVTIAGNGTYTVKATGLDLANDFNDQDYMNLIFFSTDIPTTDQVTFSDISLVVNGKSVSIEQFVVTEGSSCLRVMLQNVWDSENGIDVLPYYPVPVTDIEITFTISGFNYDNTASAPADDAATEETTEAETTETVETKSNTGLIVGGVIAGVVVVGGGAAAMVLGKKKKED